MNEDNRLLTAFQSGNSAAFGALARKYQDKIYNLCRHMLVDPDDAHDAAQDAFVKAFQGLKDFTPSSTFYTWLYRIAFNVAASKRRRHKPTLSVEQAREATGREPVDTQLNPSEQIELDERSRQVRRAIAALSEEHRTVLVLREIDGCCYETIAEVLALPIGTVRSRLHRARLQLRDQLKEMLIIDESGLRE